MSRADTRCSSRAVVVHPPFLLDVLFTFNIMLGLLMVMITLNTRKPLEFVVPCCPSYRHPVATRSQRRIHKVVLVDGHTGTDAAGKVLNPSVSS